MIRWIEVASGDLPDAGPTEAWARDGRDPAGWIRVRAAGNGLPGWRLVSEPLPPETAAAFAACLRACGYRTLSG